MKPYQEKSFKIREMQLCKRALTLQKNKKLIIPWPLMFEEGEDRWILIVLNPPHNHASYCDSTSIPLNIDRKTIVEM